jgi:uncharacterized coiled-coil protein SlyX
MDAAKIPWRPLGEVLVEHGVLTSSELETALAEQQRTGRKLGEIIVEQGFASSPAVTRALAAQWGLEVSAEGGFGSGLWGEIERRHKEKRDRETESKPPREHMIIEFPGGTMRALDPPAGEDESHEDLDSELRSRLEDAERRLEERTKSVTELEAVLEETRAELGRLRTRLAERDREFAEPAADTPSEAVATAHVLFVPGPAGYELVEREGAPPEPGDLVELEDGRALVVAKLAQTPLPGDRRPCAYLEAARPTA